MKEALCIVLLSVYAYGTYQRNKVWRTEETLWKDVIEKNPRSGRGLMNYGLALMQRGDYVGAMRYYERAMAFVPNYPFLHTNIGICLASTGRFPEAIMHFRRSEELDPQNGYGLRRFHQVWYDKWEAEAERIQK